jgi:hypothetical protein
MEQLVGEGRHVAGARAWRSVRVLGPRGELEAAVVLVLLRLPVMLLNVRGVV